jgi:stage V sporulation protein R
MSLKRFEEIKEVAVDLGLDFFDTYFETVPMDIMAEIAAYGLPTRPQHWSYGKVYNRYRVHGRMGLSKIYEIVLNNDPCYAFLLDTNTEVANLLVAAHVYAHCDFFKHNTLFRDTNRDMVNEAMQHAVRVDEYIEKYGLEKVEKVMDIAFAVDKHIDYNKGLYRKKYPPRQVVEKEVAADEYADLFGEETFAIVEEVTGDRLPPHPEKDILWFLANYAPLEPWERDILEMVREESFYFYPQFETKILNEGWASYWHAEIMNKYENLSPQETIDFAVLHASVVNPGGMASINPYYLGYKILMDIEKRWDEMYREGKSDIDGRAKLFKVREEENDISFISNYLTQELAEELKLFTYGNACGHTPDGKGRCGRCGEIEIKSRDLDAVIRSLIAPRANYGVPRVVIGEVKNGELYMEQDPQELGGLDKKYADKTIDYIHQLWRHRVHIRTVDQGGKELWLSCCEDGPSVSKEEGNKKKEEGEPSAA